VPEQPKPKPTRDPDRPQTPEDAFADRSRHWLRSVSARGRGSAPRAACPVLVPSHRLGLGVTWSYTSRSSGHAFGQRYHATATKHIPPRRVLATMCRTAMLCFYLGRDSRASAVCGRALVQHAIAKILASRAPRSRSPDGRLPTDSARPRARPDRVLDQAWQGEAISGERMPRPASDRANEDVGTWHDRAQRELAPPRGIARDSNPLSCRGPVAPDPRPSRNPEAQGLRITRQGSLRVLDGVTTNAVRILRQRKTASRSTSGSAAFNTREPLWGPSK